MKDTLSIETKTYYVEVLNYDKSSGECVICAWPICDNDKDASAAARFAASDGLGSLICGDLTLLDIMEDLSIGQLASIDQFLMQN